MDFRQIKNEAKGALVGNRFMMLLVFIVYDVILAALGGTGIGFLVAPVFMAGYFLVNKILLKEKRVEFESLFNYFKDLDHAIKLLGVYLLYIVIVTAGTILLIIPGIIFAFQYSQAPYIMAEDPNIGVWDAMKKSKELMVGHKFELFVFYLSFIGHFILGAITFGIWLLYIIPYFQASQVNYYLHLSGQDIQKVEQPIEQINY